MNIKTEQIQLGTLRVDVIHKDIKNIHLNVLPPNGKVRISAPYRMDLDTIRIYTISKLAWIKKQQAKFLQQEREAPREYVSRESHYYKGQRYLLRVIYHQGPPKVILRNKEYIDLYVQKGSNVEKRKKVMTEWYRKQLKERIPFLIEKWQKIIGVEVKDWGVRQMKTRWGSCTVKAKRIWLNLELAKKPEYCLEYVIVHEMLHLLERKHNDRFVAYLDHFMPQWRSYKAELNQYIGTNNFLERKKLNN